VHKCLVQRAAWPLKSSWNKDTLFYFSWNRGTILGPCCELWPLSQLLLLAWTVRHLGKRSIGEIAFSGSTTTCASKCSGPVSVLDDDMVELQVVGALAAKFTRHWFTWQRQKPNVRSMCPWTWPVSSELLLLALQSACCWDGCWDLILGALWRAMEGGG